jgi:hypothetical protein
MNDIDTVERDAPAPPRSRLRLYVAKNTPNSSRAERNLMTALADRDAEYAPELEIIDVFTSGRRTVMMGDLSDSAKLQLLLSSL